jgi:hypothetical protein
MRAHPLRALAPALLAAALGLAGPAGAQDTGEERFRELSDLDNLSRKLEEKEKQNRPPFEVPLSQVSPFDALPIYKPNHWNTLTLQIRANFATYEGMLRTASEVDGRPQVPLPDMPHAMVFRRDATLPKEQWLRRSFQFLLPSPSKQLVTELARPGAIRPDFGYLVPLQRIEAHQMLVPILSADPGAYNGWRTMFATVPTSGDRDPAAVEKQRYYHLVLPQDPARPNLSPHPLTWTTISHVVWDGFEPEALTSGPLGQQQAMIDWLHWGGQLIVVAAGPNVAALQDSFLGPYLPATASGRSASLKAEDLAALSAAYPPPKAVEQIDFPPGMVAPPFPGAGNGRARPESPPDSPPPRYDPPEPIAPPDGRPLFLAGLEPKDEPGVVAYGLGDPGGHVLAVERRVGRGRVLMLGVNPNDPALASWRGQDTWIRRFVLRRPEEAWGGKDRLAYQILGGPHLSWVRYLSRDLGARPVGPSADPADAPLLGDLPLPPEPVAAWSDLGSALPVMARGTLETASGITIPGANFVLRVIVVYIVALVPLNWLVCRFALRRRELAWAVVPFLAFGFAYGVERMAAYDVGFDSACDEIDLVEIQGTYPRAHVSRFASLYSTGRVRYEVAYPDDPSALALPMKSVEGLRGEEVAYSTFQTTPEPALADFGVEPRSLAMYRAEAMTALGGGIELEGPIDGGTLVNGTEMDLHDAVLIDVSNRRRLWLGEVGRWPRDEGEKAAGAHRVELAGRPDAPPPGAPAAATPGWAELPEYLDLLRDYDWGGPADAGEVRLVAWADGPHPGQRFTPRIDRHRGVRLVVAHLRFGNPDPDASPYRHDEPIAPPEDEPEPGGDALGDAGPSPPPPGLAAVAGPSPRTPRP